MKKSLEDQLKELLDEDISSARKHQNSRFEEMAGSFKSSIILFGAGIIGRKILRVLRNDNIEPLAFVDNNSQIWNKFVDGLRVLSPQEAAQKFSDKAVFIVGIWAPYHSYLKTKRQLLDLGCSIIVPFQVLFWKYPDKLLPHYQFSLADKILQQSSDIQKSFNLLNDTESQNQYLAHLRWRLWLDFENLPLPSPSDQYFPSDIISLSSAEVFVDCGAYDGDSIRNFLSRQGSNFKKIIAYEPDRLNFKRLEEYILTLKNQTKGKIISYNLAVGSRRKKVYFEDSGTMKSSISKTGSNELNCISLDEDFLNDTPTFLKFDVEGAEYEALVGAKNNIERAQPIVAVCVYHRPNDLWQLPLYLHSLNNGYRFFLRTHDEDGREIVLYAIPSKRILIK